MNSAQSEVSKLSLKLKIDEDLMAQIGFEFQKISALGAELYKKSRIEKIKFLEFKPNLSHQIFIYCQMKIQKINLDLVLPYKTIRHNVPIRVKECVLSSVKEI